MNILKTYESFLLESLDVFNDFIEHYSKKAYVAVIKNLKKEVLKHIGVELLSTEDSAGDDYFIIKDLKISIRIWRDGKFSNIIIEDNITGKIIKYHDTNNKAARSISGTIQTINSYLKIMLKEDQIIKRQSERGIDKYNL